MDYDFLHLVPPQTAPDFITNSGLAAPNSFTDVDIHTLQSKKFPNIFGIGDSANLPTAKTAAGVFAQVPVLVNNIFRHMDKKSLNGKYDGYNSCPIFTGNKELMLVEFKYDNLPAETFYNSQTKPEWIWYMMKKEVFPRAYFSLSMRGYWFGKNMIF